MKEFSCKWLPPIITLDQFDNKWEIYNSKLYEIFLRDFVNSNPKFKNKIVMIRINPMQDNYEHGFVHLTCISSKNKTNPNDRIPDLRRCERIEWNKKIIENYECQETCLDCNKVKYYEHYYKNNIRANLVFLDARFKVILEFRKNYILLITGYYLLSNYAINDEKNRIKKYEQQKTPLD